MSERRKRNMDKEDDSMTPIQYNEKIFLAEFEESLKEMQEMKKTNNKSTQSSWRDLFNTEEE